MLQIQIYLLKMSLCIGFKGTYGLLISHKDYLTVSILTQGSLYSNIEIYAYKMQ